MDTAKQHWLILRRLGIELANKVRSFLVVGRNGDGLLVITEEGNGFWLGKIQFDLGGSRTANEPTPLNIPDLVSMAQSRHQIMLLNKRGEIYSIGDNKHGKFGLGTVDQETDLSPKLISIPHKFISVRCGYRHILALTEDGKCWAWGLNNFGQVGVIDLDDRFLFPRQIPELDHHRVVAVECGGLHSLALTDQGEVYAWGSNFLEQIGQLGNGNEREKLPPTRIPTLCPVKSMAAGARHTLLLSEDGEVWACGGNGFSQLGLPTISIKSSASLVKVAGLPSISQIASHHSIHLSIAMSSDQRCFVWGQLRDKTTIPTPREFPPFYSTVESPLSFYSPLRSTPHSVTIPETPPSPLSARMSRMFDNPETSPDVQFVVEQRTIHAHQIILSNSSDYFAQMFSELGSVDPEDPIFKVTIPDLSYQTFHAFLRFLYTDYFELYPDLLPELFELANFYLIPDLLQVCLLRMRTTLTPATCCLYYQFTNRSSLPELDSFRQELVHFASTKMSELSATSAYQSMEPDFRDNLTNAVKLINHNL